MEEDNGRRRLFKRRTRKPSFVLAVIVNTFQMLMLFVLLLGLAGVGAVVGIAKAYVETAPLDIARSATGSTSFFYDRDGKLIWTTGHGKPHRGEHQHHHCATPLW